MRLIHLKGRGKSTKERREYIKWNSKQGRKDKIQSTNGDVAL